MATDFRKYLAIQIVSEKRTVSYRSLSRALKVHVNAAKCMLYDFYEQEQKRKAGSINATYMVAGVKKVQDVKPLTNGRSNGINGNDVSMLPSSPPPFTSSMLEPSQEDEVDQQEDRLKVPVTTVTLVREESLEELKEQYETITSIHIYSLSPHQIPDLVELTDIGRAIWTDHFVKEDPLKHNKTYGVILNPEVRRRKGRRPPVVEAAQPKFKAVKEESKAAPKDTAQAPTVKKEDSRPGSAGSTTSSASTKQPTLRRDASDLFKSFAKTRPPKPKLGREDTGTSTEDTKMTDADEEGESEDDALFLDTNTRTKKRGSDVKKERADKAAKLRKMMDSDDEAETALPDVEMASDAKAAPPAARNGGDDAENNKEDVAWSDSDTEKQRQQAPGKDNSTQPEEGGQIKAEAAAEAEAEPKRRRGRRKVMKKRTMKDEEGYLVTKEEAVWESFSEEEEPEVKKPKLAFPAKGSSQARSSAASGKGAGKGSGTGAGAGAGAKGGNNIMNFFGKK